MSVNFNAAKYTGEMLYDLKRLVAFDSSRKPAVGCKPFGEENAACLTEALLMAREYGFTTKNLDYYCGYAEMGSGKEITGIVTHLDIVPAGSGWDTDPFTLTEKDGVYYGRGVGDDKGAFIASLYAMRLLRESGFEPKKRIRLIMGCAEESGTECMDYYNAHGEKVTHGFTPDGDFPGIFGEKGRCAMTLKSRKTKIISMKGGTVENAVCSECTAEVYKNDIDASKLIASLSSSPLVSYSVNEENGKIIIDSVGKAAHAAHPLAGINAAGYTMKALYDAGIDDGFVKLYLDTVGLTCDGEGLGLKCSDKYGALTLNNGTVRTENGEIIFTIDIRYPVTLTEKELRKKCEGRLGNEYGKITIESVGKPLFYPEDSELVTRLRNAYIDVTGDKDTLPMVIGGGTYAKSIENIIAFGCKFPTSENHIHEANERITADELVMQAEIYANAIMALDDM